MTYHALTSPPRRGDRPGRRGPHSGWYVAAGLCVLLGGGYYAREQGLFVPPHERAVRPLVNAVGERRFFEPRLSGGFKYGPLVSAKRGGGPAPAVDASGSVPRVPAGPAAEDWAILAAAAKIKKTHAANDSPHTRSALAAAHLLMGEVDEAVRLLEREVRDQESAGADAEARARVLSDLAAAYLTRATTGSAEDYPDALEAASRAAELQPALPEALFNRALALEGLALKREALKAWDAFLGLGAESPWRAGAELHRASLEVALQSQGPRDVDLVRQALVSADPAQLERTVEQHASAARDVFDFELLADLHSNRQAAQRLAKAMNKVTQDPSAVLFLNSPNLLRRAHAYSEARRLYEAFQRTKAQALFEEVIRLGAPDDAFSMWAEQHLAVIRQTLSVVGALQLVRDQRERASRHGLPVLHARLRWFQGILEVTSGDLDAAQESFGSAQHLLQVSKIHDHAAFMSSQLADLSARVRDRPNTWRARSAALRSADRIREPPRRGGVYLGGAREAIDFGLFRTAIAILDEVAEERGRNSPHWFAERARALNGLSPERGFDELRQAAAEADQVQDAASRQRALVDVRMAGGLLGPAGSQNSEERIRDAIAAANERTAEHKLPALYLNLALGQRARGDRPAAVASVRLAVRYFEKTVNDEDLLLATAGPVVSLYGTLLELEQESDETADNLLEIAERVYAFCLKGRFEPGADISTAAIPENAAVIAFFRTPSAVLAWHVTRSGVSVFRLNDSDRAPRRFEDDVRAILDDPAVSVAPLSKVLLAPLLPHLKGVERIAVVPHAYLHDVPWAELFATEGINARVTLAPTVEFALQPRFDGLSPQPPVLALVGDKPGPGWPPLPGTAIEAERTVAAAEGRVVRGAAGIAALRSSTPRFLHVSAHTTLNPARPSRSGFILGPGQDDFLSARNIKELDLRGVSAVTVGGCSAARSVPLGAQTFSLVRPFLQAGATAVFGSLIPVDDQDSPPLFEAIYRGLGKGLVLSEAVALASKLHPGPLVRRGVTYASLYE